MLETLEASIESRQENLSLNSVDNVQLTEGQEKALEAFIGFLTDPNETVFVLEGYSGCGKSTLVRVLIDRLPKIMRAARLINPMTKDYPIELTATTNKAAENLSQITGMEVRTIHSVLGLRVSSNKFGETSLKVSKNSPLEDTLLFIDEASYIDSQLLKYIFQLTKNCKVVFIGDPAQLTPVKAKSASVFEAKFPGAALTEVVRQAEGNPIVDLSTKFRETVNTGQFFSFTPDGHHIQYLERDDFERAIEAEFTRPGWSYKDSKILAWTNKCVERYNTAVKNMVKGDPNFKVGDYAVCNSFISADRGSMIRTDQMVLITAIGPDKTVMGVLGNEFELDHTHKYFLPKSFADRVARLKQAKAENDSFTYMDIESTWIDLRAVYACTINKSQGSTYDRVFIDLDDVSRCNSGDQIARMLYVAVSRARHQVFLTGDLV